MNILFVYPEFPDTFWSFKHALKFVGKKSAYPPLGLLTVAAMLPASWDKRLVDLNVRALANEDLVWADYVFISAMTVQREAARRLIIQCNVAGVDVVAGGPLFTMAFEEFRGVEHFVLNEGELTLPPFLADLARGEPRHVYRSAEFPDMALSPPPLWELLNLDDYASMSIQFSRGCPFSCDFCNVTALLGRKPRIKCTEQVIAELDGMYQAGWRGPVFFVDDNFIGNKRYLKQALLPAIIDWRQDKQGFSFSTEVSINIASDDELIDLLVRAGFNKVFIGIETPGDAGLSECGKGQNVGRDVVADTKRLQRSGLAVHGGFIVGFDSDGADIFQRQFDFIQRSGIVFAMVGMLQAPPGTALYARLEREGGCSARSRATTSTAVPTSFRAWASRCCSRATTGCSTASIRPTGTPSASRPSCASTSNRPRRWLRRLGASS